MAIFRQGHPNWPKNRYFRPISGFGIDQSLLDRRVLSTFRQWSIGYSIYASPVFGIRQRRRDHAVNLVYDTKLRRYAEDNRTEFNCLQL